MHCLVKWIKFSVKKNKTLKKYWKNGKKYWKSQGKVREFCQSGKVGTLLQCNHLGEGWYTMKKHNNLIYSDWGEYCSSCQNLQFIMLLLTEPD